VKLKAKLTLVFSSLTLIVLLVSSITGYIFAKQQLSVGIQKELLSSTNAQVNNLNGWLISKAKMLEITYANIQSSIGDNEITVPMLAGYKAVDKELSDMYFGAADGKMIDGSGWTPPAGFDPRTRSWYKQALEQSKLTFSDPYLDSVTKQMAVSVAMPIKGVSGQFRGIIAEDILLQTLVDDMKGVKLYEEGYSYLIDAKGLLLTYPDPELVSKSIFEIEKFKPLNATYKEIMGNDKGFTNYTNNGEDILVVYQKVPLTGWTFVTVVPEKVIYKPLTTLKLLLSSITLIFVLAVILITLFMMKRITRPIELLTDQVNIVANGDLTVQTTVTGKDEIAELATGFNKMVLNLRNLISQVQNSSEQVAASSEELSASAEQSSLAANQIATSITGVASGTNEQLVANNEAAAVVEQMSASIQQVAVNTNQVTAQSALAEDKAQEGGKAVDKAVTQMSNIENTVNTSAKVVAKLGERSQEIGHIVDTISGIAGQTNLLALNAAIEAARAGEQGRGFAVVAEEVRKLAEQSQEATKKITDLIGEIQGDTQKAVIAMNDGTREVKTGAEVVNAAGAAFCEIAELVTHVTRQVKEISSEIQQIASSSQQIVGSVQRIDELSQISASESQSVSAATEEQMASMEEIASSSEALSKLAYDLQTAVSKFKI